MKNVIIIGAGGHAAELDDYIKSNQKFEVNNELNIIGFLDDNPDNYSRYRFSAPLLGGVKDHRVISGQNYIIGIANLLYRRIIVDRYLAEGAHFEKFIHFGAYVSDSAVIGEGSIIGPNVSIGPNVQIGKFTLINARSSLGHDSLVGEYNFISPNVCLSGFTEVGDENLLGINSATIPGIKIGNRNKIAAGMVLDQNIGDDAVVFYRFKERVIAVPKSDRQM
jgi:sugar O-acyltransferase (sialic acid O-acetyltransferase NeuD family)